MIFVDRQEAGRQLAEALAELEGEDVVVLGIPRGGVVVAAEVARAHGWPLDTVIPRKIRAPGNPELGLGAIAPSGVRVLDQRMLEMLGVSESYLEREIAEEEREIERRSHEYRRGRPPVDVKEKVAVVVDDGIATGGTATAAVRWAKAQGARRVILAVPVAPAEGVWNLSTEADEVVCLETPEPFYAVGQWYQEFPQTEDDEVLRILDDARARGDEER
ncbi:MAG TPA: phosphoribosyltransferase family protein [Actinomycetota bacterium]|nr:phosphoribosyltransferase family protein [Actinomycetota bacterium]